MTAVKLLLVSANRHTSPYPVYPLGLAYLGSFLAENMPDLEIRIFDFMNGNYVDYLAVLRDYSPDYTGISLRNIDDVNFYRQESFIDHYRQVISTTRLAGPSTIILGGAGFSIYPEHLFEMLEPDFAIYGEGETSLCKLLRVLGESDDHRNIEGLLYRENGHTVINRRKVHFQHPMLRFDSNLVDYYWKHSGMLNIQTKRGCPYQCIYCTYPLIEGSQVRTLSSEQVMKRMRMRNKKGPLWEYLIK
jgi:radical SAM superfamily enzyme YgiQ (UPF0313 family)